MARLVYSQITSLDGYIADTDGKFDWAVPDEEVHEFVNDQEQSIGTYLLGRRMYEVLQAWEILPTDVGQPATIRDFAAIWQAANKIVYSRTLNAPMTARTRIERDLDLTATERLKDTSDRDISIGGPHLAATAIRAGLVDEYRFLINPVIVGGGIRALPDGARLDLELVAQRRFGNGVVHVNYRNRSTPA